MGVVFQWCLVTIISLAVWQASAQAPGDQDSTCRQGVFADNKDFAEDVEILMDTYDYTALLNVWTLEDFDTDTSRQWTLTSGVCTQSMRASTIGSQVPQNNWLFSQYISYENANEVFFNISYSFVECVGNPNCDTPYVTLYHYETNQQQSAENVADTDNYSPLFGTESESRLTQPGGTNRAQSVSLNYVRPDPPTANGFYLGINDIGTVGMVTRIIIYYRVVRWTPRELLTCDDVAFPPQGTDSTSQETCVCDSNASQFSNTLERICDVDGLCNEDQECACSPGFQLNGVCEACPENTYKSGISNDGGCIACPVNSESRGTGNSVCACIPPNIRNEDNPGDPCTQPPSSPRLSLTGEGVPSINGDSIRVCWLPALDSGGLDDLRYNVYLYVTNEEPPVFNRVNSESIVLAEGGSNQTTLCHNLEDIATDTSYGIIVVSANSATGDPQMLANVDDVQGRSVVFFLTLGELAQVGSTSCNVAAAVVPTLFVTLIITAIVTAVVVILIMKFCFNKSSPQHKSHVAYHHNTSTSHNEYEKKEELDAPSFSPAPTPSAPPARRPPPPGPSGRPPPPGPSGRPPPPGPSGRPPPHAPAAGRPPPAPPAAAARKPPRPPVKPYVPNQ